MTVLEGDTDVSSTNEENLCEVNKKTDEITGYLWWCVNWNCNLTASVRFWIKTTVSISISKPSQL